MLVLGTLIILAAALILSALLTYPLIPYLRKKAGQNIREDGPQSHLSKAGTPSMGGIAFITACSIVYIISGAVLGASWSELLLIVCGFILYGLMGFADDFAKVAKKQNLGLRAWQKIVIQFVIGLAIAIYMAKFSEYGTTVFIPFAKIYVDFGGWYIPFVVFVMLAMSNSVNLTDGLDGLASGVTAIVAFFFTAAALSAQDQTAMYFFAALSGACLGFLIFNRNPAKIFMGDTGSMALGGGLATAAIACNMTLLLPIAGLIYVLEALSVILQVASFKLTGKRIFKMAPLHHHFELSGWSERKVVTAFWIAALVCCAAGLFAL